MEKVKRENWQTQRKEPHIYGLFYLGQNILWGFAGLIATYLTDIGIDAATASAILIIPKLWDAINDILFGYIVDRYKFKNGQKFIPWVKVGTFLVGVMVVLLFAIPADLARTTKIVWFLIAYILFDLTYTVLDTPSFSLATVMTSNIDERTSIIARGKLCAMIGGVLATLLIPLVRPSLGWFKTAVVFIIVSIAMMIPMPYTVKERVTLEGKINADPSFKEMLSYLKGNKYLIIALIAMFLFGISSVEETMSLYLGRICLGNESMTTLVAGGAALSVILVSAVVPVLSRKFDKFYVIVFGCGFAVLMNIASFFVGYDNIVVAIVMIMLKCTGIGFWQVIMAMIIADTVEYGTYKSGTRVTAVTFSLQLFVAKLKNALIGSVVLMTLAMTGFVEGENAVQPEGVADNIWGLFNLFPAAGFTIAIIILLVFYKLRDKDVKVMSKYNNSEITKEEAEALLLKKYGEAGM